MTRPDFLFRPEFAALFSGPSGEGTVPTTNIAAGTFKPDCMKDHTRLARTNGWLLNHCEGRWTYDLRVSAGVFFAAFAFERQADAEAFRQATASDPALIRCT